MEAAARRDFERTALPLLHDLFGVAMRLTRHRGDAEDLVQDTMVRAYRFWGSFEPGSNAKAWLMTILRHTFITGYHKRGRASSLVREVRAQLESHGDPTAVAHSMSAPPRPDEAAGQRIARAQVLEALDSLPVDYRTAVTLADLQGLSYKEIAEVMQCPIGTVMSRIYRGRKLLHALLFDHAVDLGLVEARGDSSSDPVSLDDFRALRKGGA